MFLLPGESQQTDRVPLAYTDVNDDLYHVTTAHVTDEYSTRSHDIDVTTVALQSSLSSISLDTNTIINFGNSRSKWLEIKCEDKMESSEFHVQRVHNTELMMMESSEFHVHSVKNNRKL